MMRSGDAADRCGSLGKGVSRAPADVRSTRDEEWMMALERCLHADAGLPGFCTDMVVLEEEEVEEEEAG